MKQAITLVAICSVWAGCSSGDITSPNQIVFPTSNVSFSAQVEPYLTIACSMTGCHDGSATTAGGIDLTHYYGVLNEVSRPGDTLTSELVEVMYSRVNHPGVIVANDNQRNGIKVWVLEGAKNN